MARLKFSQPGDSAAFALVCHPNRTVAEHRSDDNLSGTVRLPTPPRAMASSPVLWALWVWWIFTRASAVASASTEFFRIRSALAPHKCITSNSRRLLWLRECSTSARGWINPHHVWSFNKTWLVNLKQLEDGDGTLQAMCVTFDRAFYSHHGRPLRLRACQDGQASMDWVWEGERIRHARSAYVFDLAGYNLTNFGGNRYAPDDYGWFGFLQFSLEPKTLQLQATKSSSGRS